MTKQEKVLQNYKQIFFDKVGEPVVRKWLVKKGFTGDDLEMLYGELIEDFFNSIEHYKHNKIPFEKYVWTNFNFIMLNFISRKQRFINRFVNIESSSLSLEDSKDIFLDMDCLLEVLSKLAGELLKYMAFEDLSLREIKKLGLYDNREIKKASLELREIIKKYLNCEI
jgi:hypothetical protein